MRVLRHLLVSMGVCGKERGHRWKGRDLCRDRWKAVRTICSFNILPSLALVG